MPDRNRQILLVETPKGKLGAEHFRLAEAPMPTPQEGEVLARVRYISLDAANRAWMQGATYRSAVEAGSVMAGGALAEIVLSKSPALSPGDLVFADTGWQDYAVLPAKRAAKLPRLEPLTHLLSVYGIAGLTAYFGLLRVGKPQPGETVAVSAAAGSVGCPSSGRTGARPCPHPELAEGRWRSPRPPLRSALRPRRRSSAGMSRRRASQKYRPNISQR